LKLDDAPMSEEIKKISLTHLLAAKIRRIVLFCTERSQTNEVNKSFQ
jgi:hypothetical protein